MASKPKIPRSLTKADLGAIRMIVEKSVSEQVTKAIKDEFLRLGLATTDEGDQIAAQKDFAFVRKMRRATEAGENLVGRRIINWAVGVAGLLIAAGLGATLHNVVVPASH